MSQNDVERFIGRLITDAKFRYEAAVSLEKVCYSHGFSLSSEEISLLRKLDFSRLSLIDGTIDDSIKRT